MISRWVTANFIDGATLRFRQKLYSVGGEFDQRLNLSIDATIGIGIDRAETPLTGDKPAQASNDAMSFYAAARWEVSPDFNLSASLGRRSRFPSPRELFGESLGRFLVNPDPMGTRSQVYVSCTHGMDAANAGQTVPQLSANRSMYR